MKFPRTLRGWRALLWLALRCCPVHHCLLTVDPWTPNETVVYCWRCDGVGIWPRGALAALRMNKHA